MPAIGFAASANGADAKFAADKSDRALTAFDGVGHLAAGPVEAGAERPQAGSGSNESRIGLLKWIAAGTLVAVPLAAIFDGMRRRLWRRRS